MPAAMHTVVRERYRDWPHLTELPVPDPREGEVVVRVVASSLNTADLDLALGSPPIARVGTGLLRPRHRGLGLDVAGVVTAVGPGVSTLREGDVVWGDMFNNPGAFAEYVRTRAKALSVLPEGIEPADAACLAHSGVLALQALQNNGGVRAGERVLIVGAGGCVGPIATQIAVAWGAEVTGVDLAAKFELMRRAGAAHVLDHRTTDATQTGDRFDVVIDIAARRNFHEFRRSLTPGGHYVRVARNLAGWIAVAAFGGRRMRNVAWSPSKPADLTTLADLLRRGALTPIVDRTCTLADVPAELERLQRGETRGKVVVRI